MDLGLGLSLSKKKKRGGGGGPVLRRHWGEMWTFETMVLIIMITLLGPSLHVCIRYMFYK